MSRAWDQASSGDVSASILRGRVRAIRRVLSPETVVRIHSPHPEIYRREERAETSSNVVTFTDFQPVITALQTQISVSTIVAVLAAVAGISLLAKRQSEFSKAMVSTTLVEIYALLSFLVSLLSVLAISRLG